MRTRDNQFGRYRLIGVMASGGMARLYLAVMKGVDQFSRVVALKRVLPQFARSREFVRMFVNEAQLAARLDHPNIVRIYELGEIDGQYFISMEYLPGEDLAQILRRCKKLSRQVPTSLACAMGQSVAEALQCAHDLADEDNVKIGLVHRDVSLSNVLVTYHGVTKLADFGIAKATQSRGSSTQAGVFKGKFAYAAPEQVAGKELDARTDIFALGIVMWESLALKRLFKRANDAATINAVEKADVPSLRTLRPDIPVELDNLVLKALARRRRDRFQTAQEMADALDECQRNVSGRATAKDLRVWLEDLFGSETSALKKRIAQGRGLENLADADGLLPAYQARLRLKPVSAVESLTGSDHDDFSSSVGDADDQADLAATAVGSSGGPAMPISSPNSMPRVAWSIYEDTEGSEATRLMPELRNSGGSISGGISAFTEADFNPASQSGPLPAPAPAGLSSRWVLLGAAVGMVFLLVVLVTMAASDSGTKTPWRGAGKGELALSSTPAPAEIYIDGESTQMVTPAVLRALPTGRRVRLRVEREGYAPGEVDVQLEEGKRLERTVTLKKMALVTIAPVPDGADLFVDDTPVDNIEPVELAPGRHELRIERDGEPPLKKTIVVRPGPQTINPRE